jgi:glyoxylase-like metal-dependent hydrolase (beta-lactamase superfamily II)
VTTHRHWDHWQALAEVAAATGAVIIAHPDDAGELPVPATSLVRGGDRVAVGGTSVSVIHLRGHTPGSIALCYDADGALADSPHLFTGDSLFPGGPGNTEGDPRRFDQLMDDLEERVFGTLPDGTWVYPGHGKDTTLGAERPHLAEWRERGW